MKKLYQITKFVLVVFFPHVKNRISILGIVFKKINILRRNNGTLFTVKYIKECRLHLTRYLCGEPIKVSSMKISLDKEGFPSLFKDLKPLIHGTIEERRFALTIACISRGLKPMRKEVIPVSYKTVTEPSKQTGSLNPVLIDTVLHSLKVEKLDFDFDLTKLKLITKAGPHGPATLSILHSVRLFTSALHVGILGFASDKAVQ
jgi:hypothetical protein